jgi:hypothetical protein
MDYKGPRRPQTKLEERREKINKYKMEKREIFI